MSAKVNASVETIGKKLRQEWSDLVASPLPERLVILLAQLERWNQPPPPRNDQQNNPRLN